MWRGTVFEGIHEEAKLCLGLFFGKAQVLKHELLRVAVVNPDGPTAYFHTIDHQVVSIGPYFTRGGVQFVNVLSLG